MWEGTQHPKILGILQAKKFLSVHIVFRRVLVSQVSPLITFLVRCYRFGRQLPGMYPLTPGQGEILLPLVKLSTHQDFMSCICLKSKGSLLILNINTSHITNYLYLRVLLQSCYICFWQTPRP